MSRSTKTAAKGAQQFVNGKVSEHAQTSSTHSLHHDSLWWPETVQVIYLPCPLTMSDVHRWPQEAAHVGRSKSWCLTFTWRSAPGGTWRHSRLARPAPPRNVPNFIRFRCLATTAKLFFRVTCAEYIDYKLSPSHMSRHQIITESRKEHHMDTQVRCVKGTWMRQTEVSTSMKLIKYRHL